MADVTRKPEVRWGMTTDGGDVTWVPCGALIIQAATPCPSRSCSARSTRWNSASRGGRRESRGSCRTAREGRWADRPCGCMMTARFDLLNHNLKALGYDKKVTKHQPGLFHSLLPVP